LLVKMASAAILGRRRRIMIVVKNNILIPATARRTVQNHKAKMFVAMALQPRGLSNSSA